MYLSMTQGDFEDVIHEAPLIVAWRMGIPIDSDPDYVKAEIMAKDPLAAALLDKYIKVYTEWWETSGKVKPENVEAIRRLIDRRGLIRSSLMNYLNSEYLPIMPL